MNDQTPSDKPTPRDVFAGLSDRGRRQVEGVFGAKADPAGAADRAAQRAARSFAAAAPLEGEHAELPVGSLEDARLVRYEPLRLRVEALLQLGFLTEHARWSMVREKLEGQFADWIVERAEEAYLEGMRVANAPATSGELEAARRELEAARWSGIQAGREQAAEEIMAKLPSRESAASVDHALAPDSPAIPHPGGDTPFDDAFPWLAGVLRFRGVDVDGLSARIFDEADK